MKLSIQSDTPDVVHARLSGRVSQRNLEEGEPFTDTLGEGVFSRPILLDMSEVSSLDSSGVNWLLISQRRMCEGGGHLVLHSLSPIAKNVLRVLNLHTVLELADDKETALQALRGDA